MPWCWSQVCWPFNTYVQPSAGNFTGDFQAQDAVMQGLGWNVVNKTLELFTTANITSTLPVSIVVRILKHIHLGSQISEFVYAMCRNGAHSHIEALAWREELK